MKLAVIGDIHGRDSWKKVKDWDELVFIGDYFDSFNVPAIDQIHNFGEILELKRSSKKPVTLLIGNHDAHYLGCSKCSGFQYDKKDAITKTLLDALEDLQMSYYQGNVLFTHAGVGETWLKLRGYDGLLEPKEISEFTNNLWLKNKEGFSFRGQDPYGDDITQTPLWIRPDSLVKDTKNMEFIQVVGHTGQATINQREGKFFVDTLPRQYLLIENKSFLPQILP